MSSFKQVVIQRFQDNLRHLLVVRPGYDTSVCSAEQPLRTVPCRYYASTLQAAGHRQRRLLHRLHSAAHRDRVRYAHGASCAELLTGYSRGTAGVLTG